MKSLSITRFSLLLAVLALMSCQESGRPGSAPRTDTVLITGMQFRPALLWANRGDTIVWINKDIVGHDVTSIATKQWASDTIAPGESWKTTVGSTTEYICSIHPTMKAKVQTRE